MSVRQPALTELRRLSDARGLQLTDEDLASFQALMGTTLASYAELDRLAEPLPPVRYPREAGYRPAPRDNPLNAWYWRCSIRGAREGPLAGKKIAVKDNIAVAGVPMMNGSQTLDGYVPNMDATVVTRILDAGGEIAGKAACEDLCFSGGSHTCATGPVRNPWDPGRTTGGSSAGSAALVAVGEADMALGGDQGGSIRIPSCWCGTVGHKPTYGLVPYTGAFPIELTLDHLGPIARTVADAAALLEVIAGPDGLDPRQSAGISPEPYTARLHEGGSGLRVGVVTEGFGWPGLSEAAVDEAVRAAVTRFEKVGGSVREVSVPLHRTGIHIWNAIAVEGAAALMINGNGFGTNWKGLYATSLIDVYARGRRTRAQDLSETVKLVWLLGDYMAGRYHGRYYAKGQNLARMLRAGYDDALADVDILAMPTLPMTAPPIPGPDAPRQEYVARALEMIPNTAPFDVTGHPAVNVPCGKVAGLPAGMMLIGRHGQDARVLQAARAFEEQVGGFENLLGRPS